MIVLSVTCFSVKGSTPTSISTEKAGQPSLNPLDDDETRIAESGTISPRTELGALRGQRRPLFLALTRVTT